MFGFFDRLNEKFEIRQQDGSYMPMETVQSRKENPSEDYLIEMVKEVGNMDRSNARRAIRDCREQLSKMIDTCNLHGIDVGDAFLAVGEELGTQSQEFEIFALVTRHDAEIKSNSNQPGWGGKLFQLALSAVLAYPLIRAAGRR